MKNLFAASLLATGMVLAAASAQAAPLATEDFNSFTTIPAAGTSAPSDLGSSFTYFTAFGGGATSGYTADATSFEGQGLTYLGAEDNALLLGDELTGLTTDTYTVAFALKYTGGTVAANIRTQGIHFNSEGNIDNPDFMLRCGTDAAVTRGLIVTRSDGASFTSVPMTDGVWHRIILVYYPDAANALLGIWIDPADSSATPDFVSSSMLASQSLTTGFGSWGFAALFFAANPASPTMFFDKIMVYDNDSTASFDEANDALKAAGYGPEFWQQVEY